MVAIKDMEMPSCCAKCERFLGACKYVDFGDYRTERNPNCPLVEIKVIEQESCCNCIEFKKYAKEMGFEIEREPCEDAISRQAVLDGIEELKKSPWATDKRGFGFEYLIKEALEVVADLCVKQAPSVNPQEPKYCDRNICIKNEYNGIGCDECEVTKSQEPKTGHWIYIGNKDINHSMKIVECDSCHKRNYGSSDYCPNCGAKMESEEI